MEFLGAALIETVEVAPPMFTSLPTPNGTDR